MYVVVKHFHIFTVVLSILLFSLRYVLMMMDSKLCHWKPLKIVPHINDSLLLLSGVYLIFLTGFMPFTSVAPWLTEKLFCVLAYIVTGFFTLKFAHSKMTRSVAFAIAIAWVAMAGKIAVTKMPIFL